MRKFVIEKETDTKIIVSCYESFDKRNKCCRKKYVNMFCFLLQSKIRFGVTMDGCQSWQLVHLLTFSLCYLLLTRKILFVVILVISQQNKKILTENYFIQNSKYAETFKRFHLFIRSLLNKWLLFGHSKMIKDFYRIILLIVILYHTYFITRFKTIKIFNHEKWFNNPIIHSRTIILTFRLCENDLSFEAILFPDFLLTDPWQISGHKNT